MWDKHKKLKVFDIGVWYTYIKHTVPVRNEGNGNFICKPRLIHSSLQINHFDIHYFSLITQKYNIQTIYKRTGQ